MNVRYANFDYSFVDAWNRGDNQVLRHISDMSNPYVLISQPNFFERILQLYKTGTGLDMYIERCIGLNFELSPYINTSAPIMQLLWDKLLIDGDLNNVIVAQTVGRLLAANWSLNLCARPWLEKYDPVRHTALGGAHTHHGAAVACLIFHQEPKYMFDSALAPKVLPAIKNGTTSLPVRRALTWRVWLAFCFHTTAPLLKTGIGLYQLIGIIDAIVPNSISLHDKWRAIGLVEKLWKTSRDKE